MTPKQSTEYLLDPTRCPYCQSEDIEGQGFEYDDMSQIIECNNCERRWKDIYTLTAVEEAP